MPGTREEVLSVLANKGFETIDIDLYSEARRCITEGVFKRGALPQAAPQEVDCSGLIKWSYGQLGIWLPRRSIQQWEFGESVRKNISQIQAGDVIFRTGRINYFDNYGHMIGHVALLTPKRTVIEARGTKMGIVERPLKEFLADGKVAGVCRFLPQGEFRTFKIPDSQCVETEDDVRWMVLQALHQKKKREVSEPA